MEYDVSTTRPVQPKNRPNTPASKKQKVKNPKDCVEAAVALSNDDFITSFLPSTRWTEYTTKSLHPRHLRLSLRPSTQLSKHDLMACFNLLEQSSKSDYAGSILGWHPHKKRKEMRLLDLKYLLVRRPPFMRPPLYRNPSSSENDLTAALHATEKIDVGPEKEVEGFVSFMPTHEDGISCLYIYEIHLSPELRGCGLGRYAVEMVEGIAEKIGVDKVMLTCFVRNKKARSFYEKLGYHVQEQVEGRKTRGKEKVADDESGYLIMAKDVGKKDAKRDVADDDWEDIAEDHRDENGAEKAKHSVPENGADRASKRIKR